MGRSSYGGKSSKSRTSSFRSRTSRRHRTKISKQKQISFRRPKTKKVKIDVLKKTSYNYIESQSKKVSTSIPKRKIEIIGETWEPQTDVRILFDNKQVEVVPDSNLYKSNISGAIRASDLGIFKGYFWIPDNVPTGVKEVKFIDINNSNNVFTTTIEATGVDIFRKITKQNIFKKFKKTVTLRVDPVAQSFYFDEDTTFFGIGIYFTSAVLNTLSNDEKPFMKIGLVQNGIPVNNSIFHEQYLDTTKIKVNDIFNLKNPTITNIDFDKPIFIPGKQEFFIQFGCKNPNYTILYSDIGKIDKKTGKIIKENPYMDGIMFASSNGNTWTPMQTSDLSFKLYQAKTASNVGDINFHIYDSDFFTNFTMLADTVIPTGTDIKYYWRRDGDNKWNEFKINESIDVLEYVDSEFKKMYIKIRLLSDGEHTPLIQYKGITILTERYLAEETGVYLSKSTYGIDKLNTVKSIIEAEFEAEEIYGNDDPTNKIKYPIDLQFAFFKEYVNDTIKSEVMGDAEEFRDVVWIRKTSDFNINVIEKIEKWETIKYELINDLSNLKRAKVLKDIFRTSILNINEIVITSTESGTITLTQDAINNYVFTNSATFGFEVMGEGSNFYNDIVYQDYESQENPLNLTDITNIKITTNPVQDLISEIFELKGLKYDLVSGEIEETIIYEFDSFDGTLYKFIATQPVDNNDVFGTNGEYDFNTIYFDIIPDSGILQPLNENGEALDLSNVSINKQYDYIFEHTFSELTNTAELLEVKDLYNDTNDDVQDEIINDTPLEMLFFKAKLFLKSKDNRYSPLINDIQYILKEDIL